MSPCVAETVGTMGIAFHNGFLVDRLGSRPMSAVAALALFSALARERRVLGRIAERGCTCPLARWAGKITAFMCSLDANGKLRGEPGQGARLAAERFREARLSSRRCTGRLRGRSEALSFFGGGYVTAASRVPFS